MLFGASSYPKKWGPISFGQIVETAYQDCVLRGIESWMQSGTLQNGIGARQTTSGFGTAETEKFLRCGWILSLDGDQFVVGWGQGHWQEAPDNAREALFAPDFYMTRNQPWWISEGTAIVSRATLTARLGAGVRAKPLHWVEPPFQHFADRFGHLQEEFRAGRARKAVPVVFSQARGQGGVETTRAVLSRALAAVQSPLRLYGWWTESEGLLGLTPEILFTISPSGEIHTMALAGTRRGRLGPAEAVDFLADPKERAEHQWVIDDLCERLAQYGHVEKGATGVLQLPSLAHLHTPIRVRATRVLEMDELAETLHPTPALGYAPRSLGMDWMKTWDDEDVRERFGAPFGVRLRTEEGVSSLCLVAIRNVQWRESASVPDRERLWRLGSGCGVVAQSVLENEWKELAAKRESVRELLGL